MATEAMVTVDDQGRVSGATASDAEVLAELAGSTYRAVLTTPKGRSLDQLGLWWSFCGLIAENYGGDTLTKDNVSDALKIECGHATVWQDHTGLFRRSPKSIAFNKLDGPEFSALLDRAFAKAGEMFGHELAEAVQAEIERRRVAEAAPQRRAA